MDKASDFESEDCRFESCQGRIFFLKNIFENHDNCSVDSAIFKCMNKNGFQIFHIESHDLIIFFAKKTIGNDLNFY